MVGEPSGWFQQPKGASLATKNNNPQEHRKTMKKHVSRMVEIMVSHVSHVFPIPFRFPTFLSMLGLLHGTSAIRKANVPRPGLEMSQQRDMHAVL